MGDLERLSPPDPDLNEDDRKLSLFVPSPEWPLLDLIETDVNELLCDLVPLLNLPMIIMNYEWPEDERFVGCE